MDFAGKKVVVAGGGGFLGTNLALRLAGLGWAPSVIFHSPYVRTMQTAASVADHFPGVQSIPAEILIHGDLTDILRLCVGHAAPLLVGH
ncbi:MAG: hypothetical protein WCG92_18055, partial [Hyphomicrobiales bacterium]